MEIIIENLKLDNVLQLSYLKYNEHYAETHFGKKGQFIVSIKSIDLNTENYDVDCKIIDVVNDEESAIKVVKQFQRLFKKMTNISLRKKGVHMQGYPIWCK